MNYFTQTVDATLLNSRAYDDSAYDLDAAAAEKGRQAVQVELDQQPLPGCLLIIGVSGLGWDFLRAFFTDATLNDGRIGRVKGTENKTGQVYMLGGGKVVIVGIPKRIDENHAFAWAEGIINGELGRKSGKVLVFGSMGSWKYGEKSESGHKEEEVKRGWLGTNGSHGVAGPGLKATMLDGVVAAILSESQFQGKEAMAYVGFHEGIAADVDDFLGLEEPLLLELKEVAPEVIPESSEKQARYVAVARKAVDQEKIGMFA